MRAAFFVPEPFPTLQYGVLALLAKSKIANSRCSMPSTNTSPAPRPGLLLLLASSPACYPRRHFCQFCQWILRGAEIAIRCSQLNLDPKPQCRFHHRHGEESPCFFESDFCEIKMSAELQSHTIWDVGFPLTKLTKHRPPKARRAASSSASSVESPFNRRGWVLRRRFLDVPKRGRMRWCCMT